MIISEQQLAQLLLGALAHRRTTDICELAVCFPDETTPPLLGYGEILDARQPDDAALCALALVTNELAVPLYPTRLATSGAEGWTTQSISLSPPDGALLFNRSAQLSLVESLPSFARGNIICRRGQRVSDDAFEAVVDGDSVGGATFPTCAMALDHLAKFSGVELTATLRAIAVRRAREYLADQVLERVNAQRAGDVWGLVYHAYHRVKGGWRCVETLEDHGLFGRRELLSAVDACFPPRPDAAPNVAHGPRVDCGPAVSFEFG